MGTHATLSGWFGVTSVSIGQCGFGFAPTRPEDRELNMRMMNRIEAIPLRSMQLGMRWDWVTFPEYLNSLDRQGLGVNVGALVPFSPLRGYVLGMKAAREAISATDAELNEMKRLLHEAMKAEPLASRPTRISKTAPKMAAPCRATWPPRRSFWASRTCSRSSASVISAGPSGFPPRRWSRAPPDGNDAAQWPAPACGRR